MYTKVSREYIFKGLEICGELSKATLANEPRKVIAERNTQLENYTNSVETALHTMITEVGVRLVYSRLRLTADTVVGPVQDDTRS